MNGGHMCAEGRRVAFFGSTFDPDERHDALLAKRAAAGAELGDPYDQVVARLLASGPAENLRFLGQIPSPGWLRPAPPPTELHRVNTAQMVAFVDEDGCRREANAVTRFVEQQVLPDIPALVAVDHSLSGGVLAALSARLGPENLSLIMLDAHTDAVPVPVTAGAVQHEAEANPRSPYDPRDPHLYGRTDSYNASSFLHHLLAEGVLLGPNVNLVGASDLPPARAARVRDERVQRYVEAYAGLKRGGVRVFPQDRLEQNALSSLLPLRRLATPYVYISIDLDVAAGRGVPSVRFAERRGLSEEALHTVVDQVLKAIRGRSQLIGFDLVEFDPRRAQAEGQDCVTYRVAADIAAKLTHAALDGTAKITTEGTRTTCI